MSDRAGCLCRGRETGCTADPPPGASRCAHCSTIHNAREAERRAARKRGLMCVVCGKPAVPVPPAVRGKKKTKRAKKALTLCKTHRRYFVERSREQKRRASSTPEASGD